MSMYAFNQTFLVLKFSGFAPGCDEIRNKKRLSDRIHYRFMDILEHSNGVSPIYTSRVVLVRPFPTQILRNFR